MSDDDEFEFQGFAPAVPAREPPPIPGGGGGGGASSGASSSSPKNQPSIGHASSLSSNTKPRSSLSSGMPVQDQHYDEAVDAESSDSLAMGGGGGGGGGGGATGGGNFRGSTGGAAASSGAGRSHNVDDDDDDDEGDGDDDDDVPEGESNDSVPAMPMNPKRGQGMMQFNKSKSDDAESEEETDGENDSTTSASASTLSAMGAPGAGGGGGGGAGGGGAGGASVPLYSPSQFSNLNVSSEIQSLFDYIQRHTPQPIQLPTPFTPFIPEYIPSIGEIDAFLKPPAPDSSFECAHGLKFVDEPSTKQSDVGVLELSLRVIGKGRGGATAKVRSLEYADRNPKKLQRWIESIDEVHRSKPAQTVMYSKPMPDIERLMQAWPTELEQAFKAAQAELQQGGTDMSTTELARLACAILDIPVHERMIESLHVLFTLYSEFRSNSHFA